MLGHVFRESFNDLFHSALLNSVDWSLHVLMYVCPLLIYLLRPVVFDSLEALSLWE